jgi:hypothetical protein
MLLYIRRGSEGVDMSVGIFWDIAQCSPYGNRRFGRTYHIYFQARKSASNKLACSSWPERILPRTLGEGGGDTFLRNLENKPG